MWRGDVTAGNGHGSMLGNGQAQHDSPKEEAQEEEEVITPRLDKGKAKADPEPEEQEKILSPNFLITESEDEDDAARSPVESEEVPDLPSSNDRYVHGQVQTLLPRANDPLMNRSRIWVEEEGEVIRKGTHLLTPEHLEGDYAGEQLRKEVRLSILVLLQQTNRLLEAMVERPPPRPLVDEFGMEIDVSDQEPPPPVAPAEEAKKPPPRPYLSRSRSSSSSSLAVSFRSPTFSPTAQPGGLNSAVSGSFSPISSPLPPATGGRP